MRSVLVTVERVPPELAGVEDLPRRPGWWWTVEAGPHRSSGWAPTEIEAWQGAGSVISGKVVSVFPPRAAV